MGQCRGDRQRHRRRHFIVIYQSSDQTEYGFGPSKYLKEITSTYGNLQLAIIESEQFAEILVKAETQASLTPSEEYRLDVWIFFHFGNWEQAFLANEQGILDSDAWLGWDRYYKWLMSKSFFLRAWKDNPVQGFTDGFTGHVDQYVKSLEP